ncbi:MAG: PTS sugar transporter subunit IIB [Oscillospiraceae bacterium]|nr:PTS sugar transporter subunit IIB [Oscillospiraceae bacterium]
MKILLICAGGMSTSMLMKKLEKYAQEKQVPLEKIIARGVGDFMDICAEYDVILLGPQVSYQKQNIAEQTGKPVDVITPYDYAVGNAENIFRQVDKLLSK